MWRSIRPWLITLFEMFVFFLIVFCICIGFYGLILGDRTLPPLDQDEYRRVITPHQLESGNYIYGGSIFTIKRLDNNDDWITLKNGGRYKYRVACGNCGECWHTPEGCFMISESWEMMQFDIGG